jgi:hypothetical protein
MVKSVSNLIAAEEKWSPPCLHIFKEGGRGIPSDSEDQEKGSIAEITENRCVLFRHLVPGVLITNEPVSSEKLRIT